MAVKEKDKLFWAEVEMLDYLARENEEIKFLYLTLSPKALALMQERAAKSAVDEVLESRAAARKAAMAIKHLR